jgi:hypothetical protein
MFTLADDAILVYGGGEPLPVTNFETGDVTPEKDGTQLYKYRVVIMAGGSTESVMVKAPATESPLSQGLIEAENLIIRPYEIEGKRGLSFRADALEAR